MGARPRHLSRLATIYDGLNVECEMFIQRPLSVLNVPEQTSEMAALYDRALNRPVLIHSISMNGASTVLKTFTDHNLNLKPEINLRGLILDSSPGHITPGTSHWAFGHAIFPKQPILARAAAVAIKPFFRLFLILRGQDLLSGTAVADRFYRDPIKVPTLMLGSEHDELVLWKDMCEYADVARKAGIDVQTRSWPDSGHVRLYRDHPTEYANLVREFTKKHLLDNR
jgi:hypothetical protein